MIPAEDRDRIRGIMRHAVWDYDVDPYELYEVVVGQRAKIGHFDAERVFLRMLERLSWYDVLDLLGVDGLRSRLAPRTIARIRREDVRERYEYVSRVLQGETVPFSGWDPASRERVRHTLLSHRWYRAEQAQVSSPSTSSDSGAPRGTCSSGSLKLVNDTAPHVGSVETDPVLGRTDNWPNILANKIAAVFRFEPKDVADIWVMARNRSFDWREVITDAMRKEGGIDPVVLHGILRSVPREELAHVAWAAPADLDAITADLSVIADDILFSRANSLCPR